MAVTVYLDPRNPEWSTTQLFDMLQNDYHGPFMDLRKSDIYSNLKASDKLFNASARSAQTIPQPRSSLSPYRSSAWGR